MKKLVLLIAALFSLNLMNGQELNKDGLYINSEGELFTGILASVKNDIRFEITVKEGKKEGKATYYFASGKVMEAGEFKDGEKDQKWTRFNENGSISAIGFYNAGKKHGAWLVYDEKGNKRFEMNYSNGEKTGTWTNWDENGVVLNTKNYSISN